MIQYKKILLTLALLLTAVTGAWAEDFLYLVVDGTSATMMYGADKGDNPYYAIVGGDANWYVLAGPEPDTYGDKMTLTTVTIDASCQNYTGTTLESLFDWWKKLTTINGLENLNTSAVTDMHRMFAACQALTSLDLSCLNTASVTNMREMFNGLTLETIDLSGWNTSNVTDMYCMFYYCSNLKNIYVGDGWSTASVTNGKLMFSGCPNLPGFDSGKVTYEMAKLVPDGYLSMKPEEIDVTWDAATRTGSFTMPGSDVEIAPIYAPVAKWATEGDAVLTPTAKEGIYAESTDAIVTAGTVAKGQGTAMYAVTSTNQATAPALDAFSADVPTAKDITAAGDVLVWYYIAGADTPDGQEATDKNTFNDSEICTTPLTVNVLSNKFDITFKAANANTIEAGKATVTVGGTAATVTEGKLEGVKMGSEVKMTAKDGYKFRKVEAKKTVPAAVTTAPTAKTGVKAGQNEAIVNAGTAEGGTMMYAVTTDNTQPASTDGFSATVPTTEGLTAGTYYVWYYVKADDSHTDSEISATGIAVTIAAPAKPEYADNAEELPANTKLYMLKDLVYNGDWTWSPTYTAEQAQAVADYYAAITETKCAVIYGHGDGTEIYYVTSDNGVSGTVFRNEDLTNKFPGYKVYLLK